MSDTCTQVRGVAKYYFDARILPKQHYLINILKALLKHIVSKIKIQERQKAISSLSFLNILSYSFLYFLFPFLFLFFSIYLFLKQALQVVDHCTFSTSEFRLLQAEFQHLNSNESFEAQLHLSSQCYWSNPYLKQATITSVQYKNPHFDLFPAIPIFPIQAFDLISQPSQPTRINTQELKKYATSEILSFPT